MIAIESMECPRCHETCWVNLGPIDDETALHESYFCCWKCKAECPLDEFMEDDDQDPCRSHESSVMALLDPRGSLELTDPIGREIAIGSLKLLWNVMGLRHHQAGIILPGMPCRYDHMVLRRLWEALADSLLGKDAPYGEELC